MLEELEPIELKTTTLTHEQFELLYLLNYTKGFDAGIKEAATNLLKIYQLGAFDEDTYKNLGIKLWKLTIELDEATKNFRTERY